MYKVGNVIAFDGKTNRNIDEKNLSQRYLLVSQKRDEWLALRLSHHTKLYPHMKQVKSIACLTGPVYANCEKIYKIADSLLNEKKYFYSKCQCERCCKESEVMLLMYLVYVFQKKRIIV